MKKLLKIIMDWIISKFKPVEEITPQAPIDTPDIPIQDFSASTEDEESSEIIMPPCAPPIEIVKPKIELLVERIYTCKTYTIGKLYVNGAYFCDTIEDTDRNLFDYMTENEISAKKVYGQTAIPCGKYNITMNARSPKFSNFSKYKWAAPFDAYLPRLLNVKGFDGVLIHVLNTAEESYGCIGVGKNEAKGSVCNSTVWFNKLMNTYLMPAKQSGTDITITIRQKY